MSQTLTIGIAEQELGTVTLNADGSLTVDGSDRLKRLLNDMRRQPLRRRMDDQKFFASLQSLHSTHYWVKRQK